MKYEEPKIEIVYIACNVFVTLSNKTDWTEDDDQYNDGSWLG